MNYQTIFCSTRGFSHKTTPCEDAAWAASENGCHIAVVSDGHGDPSCFRSQTGSGFAVEIASRELQNFACHLREQGWEDRLFDPKQREPLIRQLIRCIIGKWNLQIQEDLTANPITEDEFSLSDKYEAAYRAGERLSHIYGCTLIAALLTDRYLLVLHQGDGRCIVMHTDGSAEQPVPWDERCIGNICTSLCHEDAVESCRYYVSDQQKAPVLGCFVTTDGIEDSLDGPDALNLYFCNLSSRIARDGVAATEDELKVSLPKLSELGSADDTSLAGILDPEAAGKLSELFDLRYRVGVCEAEARKRRKKQNSMHRKRSFLREQLEQAEQALLLLPEDADAQHRAEQVRAEFEAFESLYAEKVSEEQTYLDESAALTKQIEALQPERTNAPAAEEFPAAESDACEYEDFPDDEEAPFPGEVISETEAIPVPDPEETPGKKSEFEFSPYPRYETTGQLTIPDIVDAITQKIDELLQKKKINPEEMNDDAQ